MIRHKQGFTLAEILITLGIIGVVAAMTIPALQQRIFERQTIARLRTTYSVLAQALKLSAELDDNGYPEGWGVEGRTKENATIVAEKLKPHLKIVRDCGTVVPNPCIGTEYSYLTGQRYAADDTRYYVTLFNGSTVGFSGGESSAAYDIYMYFTIDTNGPAQPNTWGRDFFEFTYNSNTGLTPSGNPNLPSNDYRKTCNISSYGYGCAYYLLTFGNMNYLH